MQIVRAAARDERLRVSPEASRVQVAREDGARQLQHPPVAAAIGSEVQVRLSSAGLTVDRTLAEVRRIAFFDPIDIFEKDGTVRLITDISPEPRACIAGIEVVELFEGTGDQKYCYGLLKKIKFHDKNSSLDKSMRYNALYRDRLEVPQKRTLEDLVLGTYDDADRGSHE